MAGTEGRTAHQCVGGDEDDQPYQLQLVCRPKSEKYARAQIVQRTSGGDLVLRGIHTGRADEDRVALTAYLLSDGHAPARLEQLVAELSLQEGVRAVHWYAGNQDEPIPARRERTSHDPGSIGAEVGTPGLQ